MVSDPYLFSENANVIANGSYRQAEAAARRHTSFQDSPYNISSFDRNATPDGPDDEFGHAGARPEIRPVISIACKNQSLPSSSRMISTIRMTPPRPIPEWP